MAAYREKEEIEFGLKRAVNGPTSGGSGFGPTAIDTLRSCDSTETIARPIPARACPAWPTSTTEKRQKV